MRLINADALIDVLAEMQGLCQTKAALVQNSKIWQQVKNMPTIEPQQQWVSCSERLPEQNGVYIVTRNISDGFEYKGITDCCYFDGSNIWHDDTRVNHGREYLTDVIAWQPLPESYREGEEC